MGRGQGRSARVGRMGGSPSWVARAGRQGGSPGCVAKAGRAPLRLDHWLHRSRCCCSSDKDRLRWIVIALNVTALTKSKGSLTIDV